MAVKESIYDGLRNNNKIEPIVVFGSAEEPVVVDGHHRLAALRGWFHDKPNKTTNVVWVDGGIEDAMYQTFSLNQATSKALVSEGSNAAGMVFALHECCNGNAIQRRWQRNVHRLNQTASAGIHRQR